MVDRARFDVNNIHSLTAVSNADGITPVSLWADPSSHSLVVGASLAKDNIPATTLTQAVAVQIVDGSGNQITSFGGGTQYTNGGVPPANPVGPTLLFNNAGAWATVGSANPLPVTGSLTVGGTTDNSAFTAGTTTGTPAMGFYHSTIDTVTDGRAATIGITNKRAMMTNLQTAAGVEITSRADNVDGVGAVATVNNLSIINRNTIWNGSSWDRLATIINSLDTIGTGIAASGLMAQFDDTSPNSITENHFGNLRMSANRNLYGTIRDAAGNERGANVNASNQLSISVDNTPTVGSITNVVHVDDNAGSLTVDNGGTFAVQEATLDAALISQEATTSGVKGITAFGAVTTAKPTYTTAKSDALSLDVNGLLRVSLADTPANGAKFLVTADPITFASAQAVTQSGNWTARIVGNAGGIVDGVIGAATAPANMLVAGGVYNSTELSPTTGQSTALQLDAKGRLRNVIMDAAGNTRGANVDANNNLGVVLAAETTKVIGVTRTSDGAGNLLTSNSTTFTAKFGLDSNLLGTLGTAFSTAGKVDVKAADGDVFIRQATGSNLNANVTLQTQTDTVMVGGVNIKEINAVTPLMGNGATGTGSLRATISSDNTAIANWGQGATGAAVPAGAQYQGNLAQTALPTAASAGNLTGTLSDKFGRPVVLPGTIRDLVGTQTTTISASTSETTVVTAAASVFNDLTALLVSNTSATAARLDFRDTTAGSILFSIYVPAGDVRGVAFNRPVPQTSVNTSWTAQSSASISDLRIYAVWDKNR